MWRVSRVCVGEVSVGGGPGRPAGEKAGRAAGAWCVVVFDVWAFAGAGAAVGVGRAVRAVRAVSGEAGVVEDVAACGVGVPAA